MASADNSSLNNLKTVYRWVIDDVSSNVQEDFLNEGVDPQVLQELKQLWWSKLENTGVMSRPSKPATVEVPQKPSSSHSSHGNQRTEKTAQAQSSPSTSHQLQESVIQVAPARGQATPTSSGPPPLINVPPDSLPVSSLGPPPPSAASISTPNVPSLVSPVMFSTAGGLTQMIPTTGGNVVIPLQTMQLLQQQAAHQANAQAQAQALSQAQAQALSQAQAQALSQAQAQALSQAQAQALSQAQAQAQALSQSQAQAQALTQAQAQAQALSQAQAQALSQAQAQARAQAQVQARAQAQTQVAQAQLRRGGHQPTTTSPPANQGRKETATAQFQQALQLQQQMQERMVMIQTPQGPAIAPLSTLLQSSQGVGMAAGQSSQSVAAVTSQPGLAVAVSSSEGSSQQLTQERMVVVQTPQGPTVIPLSKMLALQQQQRVAMAAAVASSQQSGKRLEQTDGTVPVLPQDVPLPAEKGHAKAMDGCGDVVRCGDSQSGSLKGEENSVPGVAMSRKNPVSRTHLRREGKKRSHGLLSGALVSGVAAAGGGAAAPGVRVKGRGSRCEVILQLDGATVDSSSEEETDGEEDSSEDELEEKLDEDPLNSEDDDDVGSENPGEDFETADNIVCQFEKVYRVKSKWKLQLKDGIMNVSEHEYIFHKCMGEAEW